MLTRQNQTQFESRKRSNIEAFDRQHFNLVYRYANEPVCSCGVDTRQCLQKSVAVYSDLCLKPRPPALAKGVAKNALPGGSNKTVFVWSPAVIFHRGRCKNRFAVLFPQNYDVIIFEMRGGGMSRLWHGCHGLGFLNSLEVLMWREKTQ